MPTDASGRRTAALAWTLAIGAVTIVAFGLLLWAARGFGALPVSFGRGVTGVIGLVVSPLAYITFGALLSARMPRNAVGWLFLACGLLLAMMLPVNLIVALAHESLRRPDDLTVALAWARNTFATPGVVALLISAVYLFPDGRLISRRWWAGILASAAAGMLLALGAALDPEGMVTYPTLSNPTAVSADLAPVVNAIQVTGVTIAILAAIHAVASLATRYRDGDETRRAQLRWILLATMITVFTAIPFLLTRYLIDVGNALGEIAALGVQLAMSTFPVAAAFAISRYRLYDVDLLIGRTLVYIPLMAILGGLYTAGIAVFQRLFVAVTGQTSDVAVILTVLLVASAFTPLRRGLESALERRFPTLPKHAPAAEPHATATSPGALESARVPAPVIPMAYIRPIRIDGHIDCPLVGGPLELAKCLACPQIRAIINTPQPAIVCTGNAPASS